MMNYSFKQLTDLSWGIYSESKLIAKTRCYYTALKIRELQLKKTREQMKLAQEFSFAF